MANKKLDQRRSHPSSQRNREPIAEVLSTTLLPGATVLEIAAGTGEQAVYLSERLHAAQWWPTDIDKSALSSIDAWRESNNNRIMKPAFRLDISLPVAKIRKILSANRAPSTFDVIVCINMIHISAWPVTVGLMRAAGDLLNPHGLLYLYGPYKQNGQHTSQSNAEFDNSLKARNPEWGVRNLDDVTQLASQHGLALHDVIAMPANNLSVMYQKTTDSGS